MYAERKRKRFVGFHHLSVVKSVNERGPQLVSKEPRSTAEFSRTIA